MSDLLGYHPELVRRGVFKGVDLAFLATKLWQLDAMRAEKPCPRIRWRAYARHASNRAWGTAWPSKHEITIRLGPGAAIEEAVETLLHELVHCALPDKEHHGELFCRRLIACAREAFGIERSAAELLALAPLHGTRAYAIDAVLVTEMVAHGVGEKVRVGHAVTPAPAETEEQVAARQAASRAAAIAQREAHARAKLIEWERKVEAAKRRAAGWRTKVRYYERRQAQAAKAKGS